MKKKPATKKAKRPPQKKSATKKAAKRRNPTRLIRLKGVDIDSIDSGQCRVRVELASRRRSAAGERTGPDEPDYKIMLTAQSAIEALQKLTDGRLKMDLLFIERQVIDKIGRQLVVVLIDVGSEDGMRAA